MKRLLARTLMIAAALSVAKAAAAQADWQTVQQPATWLNAFVDHAFTERSAFWFDGHWRRMNLGDEPQQLLLRPGLQFTLPSGLRLAAGYAYIATAPYGESPNAAPSREHRSWQQLVANQRFGATALTHRVRLEQRWGAPVIGADTGPFRYQQRWRYFARAQRPIGWQLSEAGPALAFVANEIFVPFGHSDGAQRRLQNRAQVGLGVPIDARQRVEIGYLHQWNRITPRETHELNHTLVLSWVWTLRR